MLIFITVLVFVASLSLARANNNSLDYYGPIEETQHTYCKIDTEEIKATANATITRQLKGVCTSKELKRAVTIILNEINALKESLLLENKINRSKRLSSSHDSNTTLPFLPTSTIPNTATVSRDGHEYAYYWAINNATHYLAIPDTLISPNFNCKGSVYYLKLSLMEYAKQSRMQLQSVTKFDSVYKIALLDTRGSWQDFSSHLLSSKGTFRVSTRKLLKYAARNNDVLLIKLIIYV